MLKDNFQKKGLLFPILPYLNFLLQKIPSKDDVEQKMFVGNIALLIMKSHLPLQFMESVCLKHLVLQLYMSLCAIPYSKIIFKHYFA